MDIPRNIIFDIYANIDLTMLAMVNLRHTFAFGSNDDNLELIAIVKDDAKIAQKLLEPDYIMTQDCVQHCIRNLHNNCLKFYPSKYLNWLDFQCAVKYENIDVLRKCKANYDNMIQPFKIAIKHNKTISLNYLIDYVKKNNIVMEDAYGRKSICYFAAKYRKFEYMKLLLQNSYSVDNEVIIKLIKNNDLKCIKYIVDERYIVSEYGLDLGDYQYWCNMAIDFQPANLEMIEYFARKFIDLKSE
jgi:hypothetical protein